MKKLTVLALFSLLLFACNSKKTYNINGEVSDKSLDGKQISILQLSDLSGMKSLDSTLIKDGTFQLKGEVDTVGWFILLLKNELGEPLYKDFYVEGNLVCTIKDGRIRLSGSPINDAYQAFEDKYTSLTGTLLKLDTSLKADPKNQELQQAFNTEYENFEKSFRSLAVKTVKDNMDNPLGLHLFQAVMSSLENEDIQNILKSAGTAFLADPKVKMVVSQLALSKKTSVGNMFADLAMFSPEGTPVTLSEFVGKGNYVLIDFWASWCGPCMRELPNVLACYKKYHPLGFDVVGVSLDEDSNAWKAAIKNNKLPWPQMSDLAGWKSIAVSTYSFSGIPHTVLLDPKGVIIAKDLRGKDLEDKLAELMKK